MVRVRSFLFLTAGVVLVAGLLAATAAPAKVPAAHRAKPGQWVVCNEVYKKESRARKAAARCAPQMSCEEYGRRKLVQPIIWRTPEIPAGYDGPSGWVRLYVYFDENGKFLSADVLDSPDSRLTEAAVAAARTMEVHVACRGGKQVPQSGQLPFAFMLV